MPFPPSSSVILVTGGARRIGAAICRHLHASGARLAIHFRVSSQEAHRLVTELNRCRPDSAHAFQADLQDTSRLPQLIAEVVNHFGQLDGLVNNASSFYATPLGTIGESDWIDLAGSNFKAPLLLAQAAAPALRERNGAVVNITDIHAERPLKGYPLYCAAKGALLTLTRALAVELAPHIRVNAVAPGSILWPNNPAFSEAQRQEIIRHTLLQRQGEPEDVASAVRFLLFEANYMTGQVLNIDGGRTAHL